MKTKSISMVYHVVTNVDPWSGELNSQLDDHMVEASSNPLAVNMTMCELRKGDANHFTERGARQFASLLCNSITAKQLTGKILIVGDSSIDFNDRTRDWKFHGRQSSRLRRVLWNKQIHATVDCVSGSGFTSRAWSNEHFRARISRRLRRAERYDAVVFVGGWNDTLSSHKMQRVKLALNSTVSMAIRLCERHRRSRETKRPYVHRRA